jgi:hypothetical protein
MTFDLIIRYATLPGGQRSASPAAASARSSRI